jgi:hypothetical protein
MPFEIKGDLLCWEWTGRCNPDGTPVIRTRKGCTTARRYYWERENGPIPEGLILWSACARNICVRPRHALAITRAEALYRSGHYKLDERRAAIALRMRRMGYTQEFTADVFNVSPGTIRAIERGAHWTGRKGENDPGTGARRKAQNRA